MGVHEDDGYEGWICEGDDGDGVMLVSLRFCSLGLW